MHQLILFGPTACGNRERLSRLLATDWRIMSIPDESATDELCSALADADSLISLSWRPEMSGNASRLRLVQALGAGVDAYDLESLPDECELCNVYEHAAPIAEYVLGAMVSLTIGFRRHDRMLRQGDWDGTGRRDGEPHEELAGKTLGMIGFGTIGREVASRAAAFGLRPCAIRSRHRESEHDPALEWIGGPEQLEMLLSTSDYVVVCCSLNGQTRGMLNDETLRSMKSSAWLINVARAEIIEQRALFDALRERRIAGAALDVWYRYPESVDERLLPSELPFHDLDNVLMTPHLSAWTHAMIERRWKKIAANLDSLALGQPLQNIVARESHSKESPGP